MNRLHNILFIFILISCLASCMHESDTVRMLDEAQERLESSPDSAFAALDSLSRRHLYTKELQARHALLYSIALEKVGIGMTNDSIINIAVDFYMDRGDKETAEQALLWREKIRQTASLIPPTDTLQRQNARIILERYEDKMRLVANRRYMFLLAMLSVLILLICGHIIKRVNTKLKSKPDDKAMELISQRLAVLDKVLASHISSDEKIYRISEEEIEGLISDRESFLTSTKVIFKERHPEFISHLESKGLSDWEIGYCCLYTLGLKGKEVGQYIQKKRHYIISHDIRQKLGLTEHDTNIGIWLRDLLSKLESHQ